MASLFLRRGRQVKQVKSYYPVSRREDVPETGFEPQSTQFLFLSADSPRQHRLSHLTGRSMLHNNDTDIPRTQSSVGMRDY